MESKNQLRKGMDLSSIVLPSLLQQVLLKMLDIDIGSSTMLQASLSSSSFANAIFSVDSHCVNKGQTTSLPASVWLNWIQRIREEGQDICTGVRSLLKTFVTSVLHLNVC